MYQFQKYNPDRPRMVTSFKGNQKLIFQGYRYNIHHIVPAKSVKTWRCVCAKKLTSARSWCKGRAETWEDDSQGTAKGEHNHEAEHDVAELEYFKSQLILAAIASPNTPLNDLIDEAGTYMSEGVTFGSRDSLKKSLTVARKSAENGGFRIKNYKNSETTKSSRAAAAAQNPPTQAPTLAYNNQNKTLMSLMLLAQHAYNNNNDADRVEQAHDLARSTASANPSNLLTHFMSQSHVSHQDILDSFDRNSPLAKLARTDESVSDMDDSGIGSILNASPQRTFHSDIQNVNSPSARSTPHSAISTVNFLPQASQKSKTAIDKAIRGASLNSIATKLSKQALANSRKSPDFPGSTISDASSEASVASFRRPLTSSIETQTETDFPETPIHKYIKHGIKEDEESNEEDDHQEHQGHDCQNGKGAECGCRVIRVCCCDNTTNCRTRKRKFAEIKSE